MNNDIYHDCGHRRRNTDKRRKHKSTNADNPSMTTNADTTPTPRTMNLHITKDELLELAKEFVEKQREVFGLSKDEMYRDLGLLVEFIDYIENPTK